MLLRSLLLNFLLVIALLFPVFVVAQEIDFESETNLWTEASGDVYRSTGNVGIGDTTPDGHLDVATASGKVAISVGRASGLSSIKAGVDADGGHLIMDSYDGSSVVGLNYYNSGDVALAFGGGDVGIGTSTPATNLHIADTGTAWLTVEADTDNATETDTAAIKLTQDGGDVFSSIGMTPDNTKDYDNSALTGGVNNALVIRNRYSTVGSQGGIQLATDAVHMTMDRTGKVGIGTTVPTAKLDVNGDFKSEAIGTILNENTGSTQSYIKAEWIESAISNGSRGTYLITVSGRRTATNNGAVISTGILSVCKAYNGGYTAYFNVISGKALSMTVTTNSSTELELWFRHSNPALTTHQYDVTQLSKSLGVGVWSTETELDTDYTTGVDDSHLTATKFVAPITMANTTAPPLLASHASIYTVSGEMKVKDASGNETTISPHPNDLLDFFEIRGAAKTLGVDYTTPATGKAVLQPKARWLEWYVEIDHSTGEWEKFNFQQESIESGQSNNLIH